MVSTDSIDPRAMMATLREWQSRIPDYRPLTQAEIMTLRRAAAMDDDWIGAAISAAGASEAVQTVLESTPEEMYREKADSLVWEEFERELRAFLKGVADTNLVRRHRLGLKTLQIYGISRHLVRQREHQDLLPFVETMIEMRKLGKRKPKAEPKAEK